MTSNFTFKSFASKDDMRIADIIHKSQGSAAKKLQLTRNMANAITDLDKARRRAEAALAVGETRMASLFFIRVGQLGGR